MYTLNARHDTNPRSSITNGSHPCGDKMTVDLNVEILMRTMINESLDTQPQNSNCV